MISLRKLDSTKINQIATIHQNAFENFFLTSLGHKFLCTFYLSIINSDKGIAIGAYEDDLLVGFAIGAKSKEGFYTQLLRSNFFALFYSAAKPLLFAPSKIFKLLKSFLTKETLDSEYLKYASLLSICVKFDKKGDNIGKKLLLEFELEAKKYSNGVTLTTDRDQNDYVNNFYSKNNYVLRNTFSQGSREMNFYSKKIN